MESYRQATVNTDNHPVLRKGQIVRILFEEEDCYIVKPYVASIEQKIKKEDLIVR